MKRTKMVLCLSAIALFLRCSRNQLTGGTGSSSSEVVGRAVYSNGHPRRRDRAPLAPITWPTPRLFRFLHKRNADGVTDDSGAFTLNTRPRRL